MGLFDKLFKNKAQKKNTDDVNELNSTACEVIKQESNGDEVYVKWSKHAHTVLNSLELYGQFGRTDRQFT